MKLKLLLVTHALCAVSAWGQVGINTTNPATTLDVVGDVKIDNSLFLENPGDYTQIRDSKLLIKSTGNEILRYDISQSKYGPINYAQFIFRNTSTNGLRDYNTKIPADDYIVSVQGYYFLEPVSGDTDIMTRSSVDTDNIEGYQIYAYVNPGTGTWFIRGFINNGKFRTRSSGYFIDTPIDLFLNLIIYRKGFITKSINSVSVDMGDVATGTAPLPTGF
ncbi:hypothetical protein ATE92_2307 [Ulvibacter sp. MAR_2010_11]|uniref:hypothetical protein n=1 Tax=Ulvibacter sp. MAR_2010_11 TaxID=1250229 RepID=UPI000C2BA5FF|nr:hypothetical protein [Ulvibacter sp. MAR_2010_11]PKA84137.1 hypothetical protein ATE92_2307 [Ulvibacter sp. MAR_2010_11]